MRHAAGQGWGGVWHAAGRWQQIPEQRQQAAVTGCSTSRRVRGLSLAASCCPAAIEGRADSTASPPRSKQTNTITATPTTLTRITATHHHPHWSHRRPTHTLARRRQRDQQQGPCHPPGTGVQGILVLCTWRQQDRFRFRSKFRSHGVTCGRQPGGTRASPAPPPRTASQYAPTHPVSKHQQASSHTACRQHAPASAVLAAPAAPLCMPPGRTLRQRCFPPSLPPSRLAQHSDSAASLPPVLNCSPTALPPSHLPQQPHSAAPAPPPHPPARPSHQTGQRPPPPHCCRQRPPASLRPAPGLPAHHTRRM